jgi:hypothetical protein
VYVCRWEIPKAESHDGLLEIGNIRFEYHPDKSNLVLITYTNAVRGAFGALLTPFRKLTRAIDIGVEQYYRATVSGFLDFFFRQVSQQQRMELAAHLDRYLIDASATSTSTAARQALRATQDVFRAPHFWQVCLGL